MTIAASFEIRFTRYLLPDGREAADLPSFASDPRALVPDYRAMVFMRALDAKAVAMQRTGQIGTYASTLGKEAIDAGIGRVLHKEDVLLPSYRESGVLMLRGVSPDITRKNLDAMLGRLKQRKIAVLLAGMRAAPNLGADYQTAFDAIFPDLAKKYDVVLYPFFLDGVAGQPGLRLEDGLHPNAHGVDVMVERILPTVEKAMAAVPGGS